MRSFIVCWIRCMPRRRTPCFSTRCTFIPPFRSTYRRFWRIEARDWCDLSLQQQRLELRFLAGLVRIRRRSGQPPLHLLKRYRVLRAWLSDFHVQDGRRSDFFEPGVLAKQLDRDDRGLKQALRLDLRGMPDLPVVHITDNAQANRHGRREYHDFRFLFARGVESIVAARGNGSRKTLKSVASPLIR